MRIFAADQYANGPTPVPPEVAVVTTDANGAYRLRLPAGRYKIGADLVSPVTGYSSSAWYGNAHAIGTSPIVTVNDDLTGVDITMLRLLSIAGRVVGRDGVGVPNAQITSWFFSGVQFPLSSAVTDSAGWFAFRSVPIKMTIGVAASGKVDTVGGTYELNATGDVADLIIPIDRGNVVTGTLRHANGAPLANTNFGVTSSAAFEACAYSCAARTDPNGRFAVTVPSGTLRFFLWPDGGPRYMSDGIAVSSDATVDPRLIAR